MKINSTEKPDTIKVEPIYTSLYNKDDIPPSSEVLANIIISNINYSILNMAYIDIKIEFVEFVTCCKDIIRNFIRLCLNPLTMSDFITIDKKKQFIANQSFYIANYIITEFYNFNIIAKGIVTDRNYYNTIENKVFNSILITLGLKPDNISN